MKLLLQTRSDEVKDANTLLDEMRVKLTLKQGMQLSVMTDFRVRNQRIGYSFSSLTSSLVIIIIDVNLFSNNNLWLIYN